MENSWVWQVEHRGDTTTVLLCETPTRYEALSGAVGWLYNRSIPGTFGICNRLIFWLDSKVTTKYKFEIPKEDLKCLDKYYEEEDGKEQETKGTEA